MSGKLTTFERALLAQFETLEAACERALKTSDSTFDHSQDFAKATAEWAEKMERRQIALEQSQRKLIKALDEQTRQTEALKAHSEALVLQVTRLLKELQK